MLKKTVTYEDPFNPGVEVTEDLYFNLTKAELVEMEMHTGGLKEHLERIVESKNGQQIMDEMKGIILSAYGRRSGTAFVKNKLIREEFESSEAYSTMFMEMVTDADAAIEFVKGIMPKDMRADIDQEELPDQQIDRPNLTVAGADPRTLSRAEMYDMDANELRSGLAEGRYILSKE